VTSIGGGLLGPRLLIHRNCVLWFNLGIFTKVLNNPAPKLGTILWKASETASAKLIQ